LSAQNPALVGWKRQSFYRRGIWAFSFVPSLYGGQTSRQLTTSAIVGKWNENRQESDDAAPAGSLILRNSVTIYLSVYVCPHDLVVRLSCRPQ